MRFYFKVGVRYRKEEDYILLCDCINLTDFQLPLEYWTLLQKLSHGYDITKIRNKQYKHLILDFKDLGLITADKKEAMTQKAMNLCLSYDEREFL